MRATSHLSKYVIIILHICNWHSTFYAYYKNASLTSTKHLYTTWQLCNWQASICTQQANKQKQASVHFRKCHLSLKRKQYSSALSLLCNEDIVNMLVLQQMQIVNQFSSLGILYQQLNVTHVCCNSYAATNLTSNILLLRHQR